MLKNIRKIIKKRPDVILASQMMHNIGQKSKGGVTRIADIMEEFKESGILLAIMFFAFPAALPLPFPPGFTTIFGIPLIILSVQVITGSSKVKLPKRVANREMQNDTLIMMSKKITPILEKIEKIVKPRMEFLNTENFQRIIGVIFLIASIAVTLPLPFTNAIPAQGIAVIALGFLNKDGLTVIIGLCIAVIGLIVAVVAIFIYWNLIVWFFNWLF